MDVYDAIGVNVERNLDLRNTTRRGRDAYQIELAEHLVVRRHLTLALENADRHGLLIVIGSRIDLALLGRDRRVAVDHAGKHATQRLDAKAQWRNVEQQHVLDVALQHACLNGGTHGDRSEAHTSELQSLMRSSYAVFCLKKKKH